MRGSRVSALFGITHPIVQGGMAWLSEAPLAAAVSEAGGLGLLGASAMTPETLRDQIDLARSVTRKPFGVNIPLLRPGVDSIIKAVIDGGVAIAFTSAGNPAAVVPALKGAGIRVVHVVSNVRQARKAVEAGCDAVVAEGFEAGGHDGADELTTISLTPQVVDAVGREVPVIAAGGIVDARGVAAAFSLGADGVQVGTRFIATPENNAHPNFKRALCEAGDTATIFVCRTYHPIRVLKNRIARDLQEKEAAGAGREELRELTGPGRGYMAAVEGDLEEGLFNCSQAAGLIREIKPAGEVVTELVRGYEEIVRRLSGAL